ncbi:unnamed protein product [Heterobilharzia americana]|nr:unnamed protein product [Heterobilharzia americana]CAH8556148.1 unnamed protein product [Heterobilharzia americana]
MFEMHPKRNSPEQNHKLIGTPDPILHLSSRLFIYSGIQLLFSIFQHNSRVLTVRMENRFVVSGILCH